MAVATRKVTTLEVCGHCKKKNELSALDLEKVGTPSLGRTRYFKYTCKHCGEENYIYSREISVHMLRELKEV